MRQCNHPMLLLGTHPDFQSKGWLCPDCRQQIKEPDLKKYCVVLAAIRKEPV